MTDTEVPHLLENFQKVRTKEGLPTASTFIHNAVNRLFANGLTPQAIVLVKELVATCRRDVLGESTKNRGKVLRKVGECLSAWQCTVPVVSEDLYYMWVVFYNTAADCSKEQGDYPQSLELLTKAERLISEMGYGLSTDLLIGIAYTKVNMSTLSLAVQECEKALNYAEESVHVITRYLNLQTLKETDCERYEAVVNSYILAHFNKAVAEEFLGLKSAAQKAYQCVLSLAAKHSYKDPFLLEEAKYALSELLTQTTQPAIQLPPASTPLKPVSSQGYYSEATLTRLAAYLKRSSSPYFISMGAYFSTKILTQLKLEKDVTHMPEYTK